METKIMDEEIGQEELFEEIDKYLDIVPDRQPGGITQKELAAKKHCSVKRAARVLEELVDQGKFVKVWSQVHRSGQGWVYYVKK